MDKFRIIGGNSISGRVTISGAKNSALPCLAAALLTPETVTLHNVPYVRDCLTQRRLLEDLGATVLIPDLHTHKITARHIELFEAPYELVKTMRARGAMTLLVSGGFTAFADPVGAMLGFERVEANRLDASDGRLSGTVSGRIVDAEHKARALVETRDALGLSASETIAIGDGANDIGLIEAAGLGIAYRAKPALAAAADARLDHHGLDALLWAQGIARADWVVA